MLCNRIYKELDCIGKQYPLDPSRNFPGFTRAFAIYFGELNQLINNKVHSDIIDIASDER